MKVVTLLTVVGYLSVVSLSLAFSAEAQTGKLIGTVRDASTGESLPYVSIVVKGTGLGAITDLEGRFCIPEVPAGTYSLEANIIGYQKGVAKVRITAGEVTRVKFRLRQSPVKLSPVVVTASKKAQLLQDAPVSVTVVGAADIQQRNEVTLDRLLEHNCPGVTFRRGEVSIRGSTGYSQGAGSRVLLLIDGTPAISGDTGSIKWDIIPTTEVERVEVIKGAGSALYGSNALSGVINIITRPPSSHPETKVNISWGFYSKPYYPEWRWTNRLLDFHNIEISHSRRLGRSSLLISGGRKCSDGYSENGDYQKWNLFGKFVSDLLPQARLSFLAAWASDNWGYSPQWKSQEKALEVPDECRNDRVLSDKLNAQASVKWVANPRLAYIFKNYFLKTYWKNRFHDNRDSADSYRTGSELRTEWLLNKRHSLTTGLEGVYNEVKSTMFGNHDTYDLSGYLQDELKLLSALKATLGMRYDAHWVDGRFWGGQFSPRWGIVYRPTEFTSLRASVGRGFRAPSVAEMFTRTMVSGFLVIPNPDIKAERTWSYEVGMNQLLGNRLVLDLALFRNDYKQMIEPKSIGGGKFQLANVTQARVQGLEVSLKGGLWRKLLSGSLSYTYIDPRDLTLNQVLPYRHRHQIGVAISSRYRAFQVGADFHYRSRCERAVDFLANDERVPQYILNLNTNIKLSNHLSLSGQVNNLLQYNYPEVPRHLAPIRNYSLTLKGKF